MAAWNELTQQERDEVSQCLAAVREWSGMVARLCNLGRAISQKYAGNVETTLGNLDAGDIPVYDSGRGEEALSKADLMTLVGYAMQSSEYVQSETPGTPTTYNTNYHRALYVRAAGLYNTIQQGSV